MSRRIAAETGAFSIMWDAAAPNSAPVYTIHGRRVTGPVFRDFVALAALGAKPELVADDTDAA